jgi:hypothetical protein
MMKNNQQPGILLLSALVLVAIMVLMGNRLLTAENFDLNRAEFFVS